MRIVYLCTDLTTYTQQKLRKMIIFINSSCMEKKNYVSPRICVVYAEACNILAGSGGLQGKTSNETTPGLGYGGDASDENKDKPDGGYEIW